MATRKFSSFINRIGSHPNPSAFVTNQQLYNDFVDDINSVYAGIEHIKIGSVASTVLREGDEYKLVADSLYEYLDAQTLAPSATITIPTTSVTAGRRLMVVFHNDSASSASVSGTNVTIESNSQSQATDLLIKNVVILTVDTVSGSNIIITAGGSNTQISNLVVRPCLGIYGADLISNGGFTSDTIWSKGGTATIHDNGGYLNAASDSLTQAMTTLVTGHIYSVKVTWASVGLGQALLDVSVGASATQHITADGSSELFFTCGASPSQGLVLTLGGSVAGAVVLVSLREVTAGNLTSFSTFAAIKDSTGLTIYGPELFPIGIGEYWDGTTLTYRQVKLDFTNNYISGTYSTDSDVTTSATTIANSAVTTGLATVNGFLDGGAPSTGATLTIPDDAHLNVFYNVHPAGALVALTINLPATPVDRQVIKISVTQAVTTFTISGNGKTLQAAPTTLGALGSVTYIYRASDTTYYYMGS